MAEIGPGLRYWLPETEFTVTATKRKTIEAADDGSSLVETVDVIVSYAAVADRTNGWLLHIDAGLLEKIDLTVTLDDRGFVTGVNSDSGRDVAPVLSLVGKVIGAATAAVVLEAEEPKAEEPVETLEKALEKKAKDGTLEKAWEHKHHELARHLRALLGQVDRLMESLGKVEPPAAVRATARALDAVQSQAASIIEVRRAWIAAHAGEVASASVRLRPFELEQLSGPELPEQLPAGHPKADQSASARLIRDFGCCLAIVDPDRQEDAQTSKGKRADKDILFVRHSRPALIGVYLKGKDEWRLDPGSIQALDVVDRHGVDSPVRLDGWWGRTRAMKLEYHPDMSIKTYGVTATPSFASLSTSLGEVLDATAAAYKAAKEKPSAEAEALAKKKAEVDRLKTETEYEVLAATRERAAAVAVAEQLAKLKG